MPKAPRRCPRAGCTNFIRFTTYCEDHTIAWETPSGWTRPPRWDGPAGIRQTILDRDNYRCHVCGRPGADTVDHITPRARGGSDHADNLGAIHDRNPPHCHRTKTNQDRANT